MSYEYRSRSDKKKISGKISQKIISPEKSEIFFPFAYHERLPGHARLPVANDPGIRLIA